MRHFVISMLVFVICNLKCNLKCIKSLRTERGITFFWIRFDNFGHSDKILRCQIEFIFVCHWHQKEDVKMLRKKQKTWHIWLPNQS